LNFKISTKLIAILTTAQSNSQEIFHLQKCLLLALWVIPAWAQQGTNYTISFPSAVHHEAEVRAEFTGVNAAALKVVMSRSSPGRYALHEFAKNVYNVRASDNEGHSLAVARMNPYSWSVATANKSTVVFEYTLFGDRTDGTYDGIDDTHAHLNMPATFSNSQFPKTANGKSPRSSCRSRMGDGQRRASNG
jgi:hypothetical protein